MKPLLLLLPLLLVGCATLPKHQPGATIVPAVQHIQADSEPIDEGGGSGLATPFYLASDELLGQAMAPNVFGSNINVTGKVCLNAACTVYVDASSGGSLELASGGAVVKAGSATGIGTSGNRWTNFFAGGTYSTNVASGSNGFANETNGARIDFGAGASDYASSDGTIVTFAGPLASSSSVTAGTLLSTPVFIVSKTGLATCNSGIEGTIRSDTLAGGTATTFRTRVCMCTSDGAASPAYAWINLAKDAASQVGTTTTCPN